MIENFGQPFKICIPARGDRREAFIGPDTPHSFEMHLCLVIKFTLS